ncbi:hypothetical protein [Campylobacter sp. MG1]|uniref:hypothetical protein n=1 Tax=Campylobacter sp. MG1 TaxID=2976332 RepID=UPI00226D3810|nr:hypothetical protein [Campylobacter sp. MG1]
MAFEISNNENFRNNLLQRLGLLGYIVKSEIEFTGLSEKNIDSILESKTKSKTDLKLQLGFCSNDKIVNISIKKSLGGQVYLITPNNFINGMENKIGKINDDIKLAINLYWGSYDDIDNIIDKHGVNKSYEFRKSRLLGDTLKNFNTKLYNDLLLWFKTNIYAITKFVFSTGLSLDKNTWAEYLWYINFVDNKNIDKIFSIEDICKKSEEHKELISYSIRKGSTINLPFGFVQWHQNSIQFHHKYDKIEKLFQLHELGQ